MKGGRLGPKNRFFRPVVRASSSGECDAPGEDGVWTDQNRSVETALVSPTIASLRGYATTASLRGYVSLRPTNRLFGRQPNLPGTMKGSPLKRPMAEPFSPGDTGDDRASLDKSPER